MVFDSHNFRNTISVDEGRAMYTVNTDFNKAFGTSEASFYILRDELVKCGLDSGQSGGLKTLSAVGLKGL